MEKVTSELGLERRELDYVWMRERVSWVEGTA
jgi:hypothetical protein